MLTGLAAPLCFNFLKLTNVENAQFISTLNPMDAIPVIGTQFQTFFPCILALLCLCNYFEFWTIICKAFGLEDLAFTSIFDETRVENGRKLIKIERSKQKRNLDSALSELELREKKSGTKKGKKSSSSSEEMDEQNRLL